MRSAALRLVIVLGVLLGQLALSGFAYARSPASTYSDILTYDAGSISFGADSAGNGYGDNVGVASYADAVGGVAWRVDSGAIRESPARVVHLRPLHEFVAPQSPGARFVAGSDGVVDTVGGSPNAVTLGRYPEYVNSAAADGSRTFNVGDAWEAMANRPGRFGGTGEGSEIWIRNTSFLDDAVARGSEIRLANDPFAPANAGSFFLREISYLEKLGYRVQGNRLVPR